MADLSNHGSVGNAYAASAASDPDLGVALEPGTYTPTARESKIIAEVDAKFDDWRKDRQSYEPEWFINAAFFRGNHNATWSTIDNRLVTAPNVQPNRTKRQINRVFAKVRARRAKFLKNRPTWVVVPATTDIKDKLNARATSKILEYIWRKLHLEEKYRDALLWSETCGRGYWWFNWDETAIGRVSMRDPLTGAARIADAVLGDVTVEPGSTFEILVGDPGAQSLAYQHEIMRVKERSIAYLQARYPDKAAFVSAERPGEVFAYENQISNLNSTGGLYGRGTSGTTASKDGDGNPTTVIVKEYFRRPTADLPKGKYCVVANGVLLKEQDELPFGFHDFPNPFPCVEFVDVPTAGQYWGTTVIAQLIDLQREYNNIRTMISTQIKLMGFPKVFVAKQHQIPEGAWTPDAGEIIEYNARPGIPEPKPWFPPNIVSDAWRAIDLIKREFDDVTQIFPSSEGNAGGSQSGFQTNLLQEATDAVHGPDVRAHELAIEEAAFKIRRIIKHGYTIQRLVTVASSAYEPEVLEFGSDEIDENADIVVQAGSALPMLKGARIQAALDLYQRGVWGDPANPQVRKRLLSLLDIGGMDEMHEYNRIDDDMINVENATAEDGAALALPRFYENHQAHWEGHINRLKQSSIMEWPSERRMELLKHAILHAMYINHAAAYQMSIEAGLQGLIPPPPPPAPTDGVPLPAPGASIPGAPSGGTATPGGDAGGAAQQSPTPQPVADVTGGPPPPTSAS